MYDARSARFWQDLDESVYGTPPEVERCPVCAEPIDYCQGHGEIGDPDGAEILARHDADDHGGCHPQADCRIENAAP
jgi:hypothetical protein